MAETIDNKVECPKGNARCDLMKYLPIYEQCGMKRTIIPICMSRLTQQYSYLAEFPEIGLEKMCRRELYQKIGKVNLE